MTSADQIFRTRIRTTDTDSLITRYYDGVREASRRIPPPAAGGFAPGFRYPDLTDAWEEYFSVARASLTRLGRHAGHDLHLLDLMKNPGTRTTKTTASLLMVARAIEHIDRTGESILLFTPSSGNKAIALRDAVGRALELGLAAPDRLRIVTLTPASTAYKFRRNVLSESAGLRALNPVLVYPGPDAGRVKEIGRAFVDAAAGTTAERVWYSLDLGNYKVADACRAFHEHEFADGSPARRRLHAHAVSSAYGLLGYQHGVDTMAELGIPHPQPGYLLVQHLATSDMVRHHLRTATGTEPAPMWKRSETEYVYEQQDLPNFPYATWDPDEQCEPTFYTHNPPTAPEMSGLMAEHGGTGVVVSLLECLERYGESRHLLCGSDAPLPADPRRLAEWSLVMGTTGVLNGLDRGLANGFGDIVLHGSGMYFDEPDRALDRTQVQTVDSVEDVVGAVL